jgi:hypothetical protein
VNMNVAWIPLIKAVSYANLDQPEKGQILLDQLKRQFPFIALSEAGLKKLFTSDKLINEIMGGLTKLTLCLIFTMANSAF